MRKLIVQWSLLLLSLGLLRIIAPPLLFSFAGMEFPFAIIASIVGLCAIVFTSSVWETIDFRPLFRIGAIASFIFFFICLFSPTFGSLRHTYVTMLDMFVLLESGIILGMASLQQKEDAMSVFTIIPLTIQLMIKQYRETGERPRLRSAH